MTDLTHIRAQYSREHAASMRPDTLYSVQALRGVAALLVVLFHLVNFRLPGGEGSGGELLFCGLPVLSYGFAGVDMFFVISGFIMVHITRNFVPNARSLGAYTFARASRIYPLWWVFAALALAYTFATGGQLDTDGSTGAYILRSFALAPQATAPMLEVGWTLVHEMFFYAAFGLLLLLPKRHLPSALMLWALALIGVSVVQDAPELAASFTDLALSPLTMEFLFGASLALLLPTLRFRSAQGLILLATGTAFFVTGMQISPDLLAVDANWAKVVLFGLPCTIMLAGAVMLERTGTRVPRPAAALGDWSYSLYLSHIFVMSAAGKAYAFAYSVTGFAMFDLAGTPARALFLVATLLACILVAGLSYHLIERPLIRLAKALRPATTIPHRTPRPHTLNP